MAAQVAARPKRRQAGDDDGRSAGLAIPALLLGVGLGGFLDGIVLHQLLQWHHMVSATEGYAATTVEGLEANTRWDGAFHVVTYLFVLAGLILLWHRRQRDGSDARSWRGVLGWALLGWGVFNIIEGVISHHLLEIHHVRPGPNQLAYDLGFLAFGAGLLCTGWLLARSSHRRA
jgi:uncharacterized membrane protein